MVELDAVADLPPQPSLGMKRGSTPFKLLLQLAGETSSRSTPATFPRRTSLACDLPVHVALEVLSLQAWVRHRERSGPFILSRRLTFNLAFLYWFPGVVVGLDLK